MAIDKFIVCAPPYMNGSAGVIVLHELCDALVKLGYEAYILLMQYSNGEWDFSYSEDEKHFNKKLLRGYLDSDCMENVINSILDNGICIYPEVVKGNPLNARNVARYFLYHEGKITGKNSNQGESDFIMAYSSAFVKNSHMELYKPVVDDAMHASGAPAAKDRSLNLTYFGKGVNHANCFLINDSVELNKDWPKTKEQLATLLRSTRYLFCWDNYSSIAVDALHCGAIPVLIQKNQTIDENNQDGSPPYLWLVIKDGVGSIEHPPDYEQKRDAYLKIISQRKSEWLEKVNSFALASVHHFD